MAAEEFGRGLNDEVRAEVEGPLEDRGHECVVDDEECAVRVGELRETLDIDDAKCGVAGCFDEDHARVLAQVFARNRTEVVEERARQASARKDLFDVAEGAAIHVG